MVVAGLAFAFGEVRQWSATGFGALNPTVTMRSILPALTGIGVGLQLITSALLFEVIKIGLQRRFGASTEDRNEPTEELAHCREVAT
jgi:hypothetical protein